MDTCVVKVVVDADLATFGLTSRLILMSLTEETLTGKAKGVDVPV